MLQVRRFLKSELAAVLRVPAFRLYTISRIGASIGQSMLQAIIAWQVYEISGSALDLGIVGLVRFLPAFALSFVSGAIVDTYDRKKVLLLAQSIPLFSSGVMLAAIIIVPSFIPFFKLLVVVEAAR